MPQRLAKTRKHRAIKAKKMGVKAKHRRENYGTTARLPLSGELPTLRYGRPVDAAEVAIPAELAASLAKKKPPARRKSA